MVHQSEAYFERCDAADRDPEVGDAHRLRCWEAWIDHQTEGQPPSKVRYARERIEALVLALHAPPAPPPPARGGAPSDAGPPTDAAALPDAGQDASPQESGRSPPPPLAGGCPARPTALPGVACPSPPERVSGPCADTCDPAWYRCVSHCTQFEHECLDACELEYRTCVGGCF